VKRVQVDHITVVSGATMSGVFGMAHSENIGVMFPALTSCSAFLNVAVSSAGPFTRLVDYTGLGLGDLQRGVAAGSSSIVLRDIPFTFGKFELTVAQADVRTLTVISRF